MRYFKSIQLDNIDDLYLCLLPELNNLSNKRVNCSMDLDEDNIVVEIDAKDKTAFCAISSSIEKLVEIHKKTKNLIKNMS